MTLATERERKDYWALQDKAIKAAEYLYPDCEDLDAQRMCANGPTIGELRKYLYPGYRWMLLDVLEDANCKAQGKDWY